MSLSFTKTPTAFENNATISLGRNVAASPAENLLPIAVAALATMIRTDETLRLETDRLRKIRDLDAKSYRSLKTRLPYVVGSTFGGGARHSDHFVAAHFVLLDLDGMSLPDGRVPECIRQHESVRLAFVSPSGAGVKVLCPLDEPCDSLAAFKEFYRPFASRFAEIVRLAGSLDLRTCDATRAAFLAHDPHLYENPLALPVAWRAYLAPTAPTADTESTIPTLDEAAYREVLRAANPRTTVKAAPQAFVPGELTRMQDDLRRHCLAHGLEVIQLTPINYGLKVQVRQGYRLAEVNLFFGKKGFTVVRSPKTGTDLALAEVLHRALEHLLHPPQEALGVSLTSLLSPN